MVQNFANVKENHHHALRCAPHPTSCILLWELKFGFISFPLGDRSCNMIR